MTYIWFWMAKPIATFLLVVFGFAAIALAVVITAAYIKLRSRWKR